MFRKLSIPNKFQAVAAIMAISAAFTGARADETAALDDEAATLGPAIGTEIPHDLAAGEQAGFAALTGARGAALVFVRSVDWCPYCKRQIIELDTARPEFLALGAELIYVSYDSPEKQQKFIERKKLAGQFVSDPQSEIIDAFGIRNENHEPGSFGHGIPHPVIFIVDEGGVILDKIYEADFATNNKSYAERPQVEIVLASVKGALAEPQTEPKTEPQAETQAGEEPAAEKNTPEQEEDTPEQSDVDQAETDEAETEEGVAAADETKDSEAE